MQRKNYTLKKSNEHENNIPITMEYELIPELSKTICHKVRIAVLAENGEQIFTAIPTRDK